MHKRGRRVLSIEHIGSAHTDDELALLLQVAEERLHGGQFALDLDGVGTGAGGASAVVEGTSSLILWDVLNSLYDDLGLDRLGDEAFRALVLGRVIEPTSKADTVRVLTEIGIASPHRVTFMRCLKRVVERDYRAVIAQACHRHATRGGGLAVVLYDVTTLHFEVEREDQLRKVGMSKERRVDPQVTVGLLTTANGFPLEIDLFAGNKAETKTLIPVLTRFRDRHQADDLVVVADAGMLSAANLLALEDNGFRFIVGSKTSKIPYELEAHVERHGNHLPDGATIETTRRMGTGTKARDRRVVYQYTFTRAQHDNRAINAMVERAEKVAAGERPLKKDRFVTFTDSTTSVNWDLVERARSLIGIKGYVTNIDPTVMDGAAVVAAYHDLYQVERSFRMTKSDLAARPVFHRLEDSIQAHLTVVLAALAISREAQARSGLSINKILKTLRPLRSATVTIGTQQVTAQPRITAETRTLLTTLGWSGH
uniref:IS1634 family transposase n=1 Tax=Salinispora mooreana TaxID=999545 RepID=UPI001CC3F42E|nr:IS1634 family transposase [Salinispora mooreana]